MLLKDKKNRVGIRLSDKEYEDLKLWCRKNNISMSAFVRSLVNSYIKNH